MTNQTTTGHMHCTKRKKNTSMLLTTLQKDIFKCFEAPHTTAGTGASQVSLGASYVHVLLSFYLFI
jgi:hypothetical protein